MSFSLAFLGSILLSKLFDRVSLIFFWFSSNALGSTVAVVVVVVVVVVVDSELELPSEATLEDSDEASVETLVVDSVVDKVVVVVAGASVVVELIFSRVAFTASRTIGEGLVS